MFKHGMYRERESMFITFWYDTHFQTPMIITGAQQQWD